MGRPLVSGKLRIRNKSSNEMINLIGDENNESTINKLYNWFFRLTKKVGNTL